MNRVGFAAVAMLLAVCGVGRAVAAGVLEVGTCVGPRGTRVVQGDYLRGIPDQVSGPTPSVMPGPGPRARPTGRKVAAGGAYTVVARTGGDLQLTATKYSEPYPPGAVVGWVRAAEFLELHPRNCN